MTTRNQATPKPTNGVEGVAPHRPAMSQREMLAEIDRVSGSSTTLGELRSRLPGGRPRRTRSGLSDMVDKSAGEGVLMGAGVIAGATVAALSSDERETLIDQALMMLEELYAHLPLKRALHAIDPIQRLRLLRLRHEALDEREFQSEMIDIFVGLRDLHTNYVLPSAYWPKFAYLPFRVEEYYVNEKRKYLVSWVSPKNTEPHLVPGVEITHWSGAPIDLAVARNAAREAGSNTEARRARGLEALTLRWLGMSLPPDEDWVTLTYNDGSTTREARIEWQVIDRDDLIEEINPQGAAQSHASLGVDVKTELLRRVRKALFDAPALKAEREMARARQSGQVDVAQGAMPEVYPQFGTVTTTSGQFGYVRLVTFVPPQGNVQGAVNEFVRILRTLPTEGLILDVRGNGGGYVNFGELILQTLCPRRITPEPFHFVTTAFTLRLAEAEGWLNDWAKPLETALSTGAGFSQGFPLTPPEACNAIGQIYQGPVVLVTDAFCYSTTDIFAAGFQDHEVGVILGCHDNTGAGGANVWDYNNVLRQLDLTPNPFVTLPGGAGMRVAARRSTRVGARSGVPLEDLGVIPDQRHYMTRDDLLKHNIDLIDHAAKILAGMDTQTLKIEPVGNAPIAQVKLTSTNIDRVDVRVDDRPVVSSDITASPTTVTLPKPLTSARVVAQGYRAGKLVASARFSLP